MTKVLSLRERLAAPLTTGRPHSFDRDFSPLVDTPLRPEMSQRERVAALGRLLSIKETTQQLAFEASDLGLSASWLRLESIEDDVGDAIAKVTAVIRKEMSV